MIPLYVIEEHHELFYIWNKATGRGFLPPFGNTLLHVDHHHDFMCGDYGADFHALFSSLEHIRTFTYEALGIADFICPAIYQGIFNEVVMLQNYRPFLSKPENKIMYLDAENQLIVQDVTPFSHIVLSKPEADQRLFTYRQGGLGDFITPQTTVLDIDLDYFCWDNSLSSITNKRLEITEQAYRDMTGNPYHPFRLFPKAMVRPVEEEGQFYLSYVGLPKPCPLPAKEQVHKRINLFVRWLKKNKSEFRLISICRSRYSGYTPRSLWVEIENGLLKHLAEIFDYDLQG
ncbi:MAG: UPF0489 family protein [Peptococcaceae bacterium]|nr:UPF0489 family protein [Peptococcaceae bacterium]